MKNVKEFDEYRKFYRNLKENEIEEMDIILVKKMMSYVDVILNHLYARDESRDLLSIEEVKFFIEKMQKSIIKNDRIELKNCVDVVECQIQDASKLVSFDYFHNRILLYIFSIISFLNLGESDDFTKALSEHISNIQFEKQTLLELKKIIIIMKKSQNYNLLLEETVYSNLEIALEMIGIYDKEEQGKRIEYTLKAVGMYKYRTT